MPPSLFYVAVVLCEICLELFARLESIMHGEISMLVVKLDDFGFPHTN